MLLATCRTPFTNRWYYHRVTFVNILLCGQQIHTEVKHLTVQEASQSFIVCPAAHTFATGQKVISVLIQLIESGKIRWMWHEARMVEKSNAHWILMRKPIEMKPLWRSARIWEDNIKTVGWWNVDWDVSQDRDKWRAVVKTVMNTGFDAI
jgi:hypothetical protein